MDLLHSGHFCGGRLAAALMTAVLHLEKGPTIVRSPSLSLRLGHLMDVVFFMLGHVKTVGFPGLTGGTGAEEIDMMLNLPEDDLAVPPFSFSL